MYEMSEKIRSLYRENLEDESLEPLVLVNKSAQPLGTISKNDGVIFYDIRGEREIQITESLTDSNFGCFPVNPELNLNFTTMIDYDPDLAVNVAFPPESKIEDSLCDILSREGLTQAKIVETEKSVHMSYFLNGKRKDPFPGEDWLFVPSLHDVVHYDEHPGMQIDNVTEKVKRVVSGSEYDVVFCNYANVDVIGHIENEDAVLKAVNTVDRNLGILVETALNNGYHTMVTADHGTVERWKYPDGAIDTGHTDNPVPFLYIPPNSVSLSSATVRAKGDITDIAPTILNLLGIKKPEIMTGKSLFSNDSNPVTPNTDHPKILIIILDGWGIGEINDDNLILKAETPVMNRFMDKYPHASLTASGTVVGMPESSVGNSETGHLHIGSGRTIYSDRLKIDRALEDKSFFLNKSFNQTIDHCINNNSTLHLLGIVSFYSSHGSLNHLFGLMELARRKQVKSLMIHALLGRRGEKPESGAVYIRQVEEKCLELNLGKTATVMGRFWALDREKNWNRVEKAYRALVNGDGIPVYLDN